MLNSVGGISYVEWVDSAMVHGWSAGADLERNIGVGMCKTVGFLVHEDTDKIVLALNAAVDEKTAPFGEIISIPQLCVRKHCAVKIMDDSK